MVKVKCLKNKYQYNDLLVRSSDSYANAKYEIILDWLAKNNVKTVLNAGCGSGELSFILAEYGYDVMGFDLDKDYVNLAMSKVKKNKVGNIKFLISSIEDFKCENKFDAVIATDVLEHIDNDKNAFKILSTFLRPKGMLIITVPAGQYLFGYHDERLGHFRRYSLKTFKKIIPKKIKTIKLRYFGFLLIPAAFLISKLVKKSYPVTKLHKNPLLSIVFKLEKKIEPPLGTSVLFFGKNP